MIPVAVMEPFHSLFYTPQYVALHGGHFAAEGLEVTVATMGGARTTASTLLDGTTRISLSGILPSLCRMDSGGEPLPHFAEVNSRNGFFLVSREPRPGFRWSDLAGKTVISFAEVPAPWQCMLAVLRREGVDPQSVTFVRDLPAAAAVAAFRAGRGDFLEQGQPAIEQLLAEGTAHLVASIGEATGPLPFSSYMTTPATLRREGDLLLSFTRGLYAAQRFIAGHDAKAIAAIVAPAFPDVAPDIRERVVARYLRQGTWARDPICRRPGYEYLQRILLDGGFIKRHHLYEDLIDTSIAERAVAEATA